MQERQYQKDLINGIYQSWHNGNRRVLAQLATAGGKTHIFSHIARDFLSQRHRVLVIAHRQELILQAKEKLEAVSGIPCGVIKAGFPMQESLSVQVASVQSLIRRKRFPDAQLLIIDEAHHAVSKTYTTIMAAYPNAFILGLTATPCRTDGQGFKFLFDDLIIGESCKNLIEQGYLSKFKVFGAASKISTKGIKKAAGDFNLGQLEDAASAITGDVVPTWMKYAQGKKTIIFCVTVKHSQAVVAEFIKHGIRAEHLDGETPDEHRTAAITRFQSGETIVLSNCQLFCEGFDVSSIEAVQVLRPTLSLILWLQMLGRGLRTSPGKEYALIIDHTDNFLRHGLPDDVREWSLEPISLKPGLFIQQCPECNHGFQPLPHEQKVNRYVLDATGKVKALYLATCPNCQFTFEWELGKGGEIIQNKPITKEDGELIEVDVNVTPKHKEIIDELVHITIRKGSNIKSVYYQLVEFYPEAVVNFTFGDLRYLSSLIKMECNKLPKIANSLLQKKMLEPVGEITPKFKQLCDDLYEMALQKKYKLSWIFFRAKEIISERQTFIKPTIADWLYLAKMLDYPPTWAYSQHK